jgi:hypothetical protein
MIAATNGWVQAYDNLSRVPPWLSDAICRLATGGGFATRELYTNREEAIFDAQRPVVLNGIDELATRSDLLDRALILNLPTIPKNQRRDEKEFWSAFRRVQPQILGALLDAVSVALRVVEGVGLKDMPRMADFAKWAVAASPKLGWGPERFLRAYAGNRDEGHELALETSPVSQVIRAFVLNEGCWEGSASDLFKRVVEPSPMEDQRRGGFPRNPRALSSVLRRLAPNLRAVGVEVTFHRDGKRRSVMIRDMEHRCVTCVISDTEEPNSPSLGLSQGNSLASPTADLRHGASPSSAVEY